MTTTNLYCEILGIDQPDLTTVKDNRDASYFSLLLVVLLERGTPVTLKEAAQRFETAGVATAERALTGLKRCRPARLPIYRDGDLYALDPHDDQTDLWAFRLGLRPPKGKPLTAAVRPDPGPLPTLDKPLTLANLEEAWEQGIQHSVSAQRLALCVLDAHGKAMVPVDVVSFVSAKSEKTSLSIDSTKYWRRGAAIIVREDGLWELDPNHKALRSARKAILERIQNLRRWSSNRLSPEQTAQSLARMEQQRKADAQAFAAKRHVLLYAFPATKPEMLTVIDIDQCQIETFIGDDIPAAVAKLTDFDIIAALEVRKLLTILGFDPGKRRLAELSPAQKTLSISKSGRTLKITTSLLIQGACGISRPFGDPKKMQNYRIENDTTKLCRRLEADAKSLYALYQYGRLHGNVRLRWGFIDTHIQAPWVHYSEAILDRLKEQALACNAPLEVVIGAAPGWAEPWSRAQPAYVRQEKDGWQSWLVDDAGYVIDEDELQLARIAGSK